MKIQKNIKIKKKRFTVVYEEGVFSFFVEESPSFDDHIKGLKSVSSYIKDKENMSVSDVFALKKFLTEFIFSVVSSKKPGYFSFSPNEEKKVFIYKTFAKKLSKKFGYELVEDGKSFYFVRSQ